MKKLLPILLVLGAILTASAVAVAQFTLDLTLSIGKTGSGSVPFTPLHTYFMAASGCSDANNGTSTSTPWCTPNHAVVCGDIILANAGSYNSGTGFPFGTVSNCPSTTGGIDGAGGVYFATVLCAGSDLEACNVTGGNGSTGAFPVNTNNWAVEGFKCNGGNANRCFMANAPTSTTIIHHIAFINNIAYNSNQGFGMNDCPGGSCNHNVPGDGTDYWAVVGNIAENAAQDGICLAAIDAVGPAQFDNNAGTHIYFGGNFSYHNPVSCAMDGEDFMFDTWDAHGVTYQGVAENNVGWSGARYGFQGFYQFANTGTATWIIKNNTFFANCAGVNSEFYCGEISIAPSGSFGTPIPYVVTIQNNIARTNFQLQGGSGGPVYAMTTSGTWASLTTGGSGPQNIFKGLRTSCTAAACDSGFNVAENDGASLGTNTYVDPAFTDTADLLANRSGTPTCTGFRNVTQCMGYDALTQTLTTPSVISDLTAGCAQCAGKGYQRPGNCQSNANYPTWLKGIVYLTASGWTNGATVSENAGLVTKPCNM